MMELTMLSIPYRDTGKRLYAIVPRLPGSITAVQRLHNDDDIWKTADMYQHWCIWLDYERSRCRPRNRTKFWLA